MKWGLGPGECVALEREVGLRMDCGVGLGCFRNRCGDDEMLLGKTQPNPAALGLGLRLQRYHTLCPATE